MPRILLVSALCFFLLACNSASTRSKGEGLKDSLDEYVASLRWSRFEKAAEYHVNKDGSRPEIDASQGEYIRVTGHSMKKKEINEALDEARVRVELQYYHNEYGTLKKILVDQEWWYGEEQKRWFLSSEFPKF